MFDRTAGRKAKADEIKLPRSLAGYKLVDHIYDSDIRAELNTRPVPFY